MRLVEAPDHAHPAANPALCLPKIHVTPHADRGEGLHRVRLHVRDALEERHHSAAGVVDDALARLVGRLDDL